MFRIILIITLVLIAIPFFNQAKNYVKEKAPSFKVVGEIAEKIFKYKDHDKK